MRAGAPGRWALAATAVLTAGACSSGAHVGVSRSVFSLHEGECVVPPGKITQQVSSLTVVPCREAHTQEVYAVVPYTGAGSSDSSVYPGQTQLTAFANGVCAQRYEGYVGVAYSDSSLFFTYLLPSPRSWEQGSDRSIICFVTTTGQKLHRSVKGSRL
jgi:hypothetical protein